MFFRLQDSTTSKRAQLNAHASPSTRMAIRTDRIGRFLIWSRHKNGSDLVEWYCPIDALPAPYILTLRMSLTKQLRALNQGANEQLHKGSLSAVELRHLAQLRTIMIASPVVFKHLAVGEVAVFDYQTSPRAKPLTLGLGMVLLMQPD